MNYDPTRTATALRQRIFESMSAEERAEYLRLNPVPAYRMHECHIWNLPELGSDDI